MSGQAGSDQYVITSTTDAPEAVALAMGNPPEPEAEANKETPSAAAEENGAPETEGDSETPGNEQEETPEKKAKGGFQKRIDKLTRERNELARQLADKTAVKPAEKAPPVEAPKPQEKPKPEDFDTYDEYNDKAIEFKLAEREAKRVEETRIAEAKAAEARIAQTFLDRTADVRKLPGYEDFDEVIESDLIISPAMQAVMFDSEVGPQLGYWLAKNPEEAERIAKLSPLAAARALGKIEDKITPEKTPAPTPKPKTSNAPEPINPVGGSKAGGTSKRLDEMDFQEYKRAREAGRNK